MNPFEDKPMTYSCLRISMHCIWNVSFSIWVPQIHWRRPRSR